MVPASTYNAVEKLKIDRRTVVCDVSLINEITEICNIIKKIIQNAECDRTTLRSFTGFMATVVSMISHFLIVSGPDGTLTPPSATPPADIKTGEAAMKIIFARFEKAAADKQDKNDLISLQAYSWLLTDTQHQTYTTFIETTVQNSRGQHIQRLALANAPQAPADGTAGAPPLPDFDLQLADASSLSAFYDKIGSDSSSSKTTAVASKAEALKKDAAASKRSRLLKSFCGGSS